jgi:carboxymethylenebutenolidase
MTEPRGAWYGARRAAAIGAAKGDGESRMERTIVTESARVEVADGTVMDAVLVRPAPSGGPRPGILLLQEIFGINAHMRDLAERLAREGYVVLVPDLFHRTAPGYVGQYDDVPASIAIAQGYTAEQNEADLKAAHARLSSLDGVDGSRLAAFGFCMGGRLAFVANAVASFRAAVSFYGNIAPDKLPLTGRLSGPMLFVWAGKDQYISPAQHHAVTEELRRHGKPFVDIEFSSVNHGFFCDTRNDYDADAAAQAWPLTLAFLRAHL